MKKKENLIDRLGKKVISAIDKKVKENLQKYEERQQRYKYRDKNKCHDVIIKKGDIPDDYMDKVRKKI